MTVVVVEMTLEAGTNYSLRWDPFLFRYTTDLLKIAYNAIKTEKRTKFGLVTCGMTYDTRKLLLLQQALE